MSSSSKRSGEDVEIDMKRSRPDEVSLQEELSDISDDPDDILNREDVSFLFLFLLDVHYVALLFFNQFYLFF